MNERRPPQGQVDYRFSSGLKRKHGKTMASELLNYRSEKSKQRSETMETHERKMTEQEQELFATAEQVVDAWLQSKNNIPITPFPPEQVYIIHSDVTEFYTPKVNADNKMNLRGREQYSTDISFIQIAIHELLHAKSYRLILDTKSAYSIQMGMAVNIFKLKSLNPENPSKRKVFFNGLNESLTEDLATDLAVALCNITPRFQQEINECRARNKNILTEYEEIFEGHIEVFGERLIDGEPTLENAYLVPRYCLRGILRSMRRAGISKPRELFVNAAYRQTPEDLDVLKKTINRVFGKYGWLLLSRWSTEEREDTISAFEMLQFAETAEPEKRDEIALDLLRKKKIVRSNWKLGEDLPATPEEIS